MSTQKPQTDAKQAADIKARWFPDHRATFLNPQDPQQFGHQMQMLKWSKPNTGIYRCHYIISANNLIVYGDIGEAVYQWSEQLTWEFLAGLNLDYFAGKCQASEKGRGYKTWDADVANAELERHFTEHPEDRRKWDDCNGRFDTDTASQMDWTMFLLENGYDVFGDLDGWGAIGERVDNRCQAHLIGIQMAVEQAKNAVCEIDMEALKNMPPVTGINFVGIKNPE